jgi:hypothetical protein
MTVICSFPCAVLQRIDVREAEKGMKVIKEEEKGRC